MAPRKTKKTATATIDPSKYDYKTAKTVGKDGKTVKSLGNGDAVQKAMLLFKASGKDISQVIKANGLPQVVSNYDNLGLLRMSVGNSLRALVKAGTPVTIGSITVSKLSQRVALTEAKAAA